MENFTLDIPNYGAYTMKRRDLNHIRQNVMNEISKNETTIVNHNTILPTDSVKRMVYDGLILREVYNKNKPGNVELVELTVKDIVDKIDSKYEELKIDESKSDYDINDVIKQVNEGLNKFYDTKFNDWSDKPKESFTEIRPLRPATSLNIIAIALIILVVIILFCFIFYFINRSRNSTNIETRDE